MSDKLLVSSSSSSSSSPAVAGRPAAPQPSTNTALVLRAPDAGQSQAIVPVAAAAERARQQDQQPKVQEPTEPQGKHPAQKGARRQRRQEGRAPNVHAAAAPPVHATPSGESEATRLAALVNGPYMAHLRHVAANDQSITEAQESDAQTKLQERMTQKRLTEKHKTDQRMMQHVNALTEKHSAVDASRALMSGIQNANAFAAVQKAHATAHNQAAKEQSETLARAATALVGEPCVIAGCPHLGRAKYFGMCAERHWKGMNRIPDNIPYEARQRLIMARKRARSEANLQARNAKFAQVMNSVKKHKHKGADPQ